VRSPRSRSTDKEWQREKKKGKRALLLVSGGRGGQVSPKEKKRGKGSDGSNAKVKKKAGKEYGEEASWPAQR